MDNRKEITRSESQAPARQAEEEFRTPEVDILETNESLVLLADMPGVKENGVEVSVEEQTLTIIGRVEPKPEAPNVLYAEFAPFSFKRVFTLSSEINRNGIEGKMKNGVLRLTLPKMEEAKVRRIPIQAS